MIGYLTLILSVSGIPPDSTKQIQKYRRIYEEINSFRVGGVDNAIIYWR